MIISEWMAIVNPNACGGNVSQEWPSLSQKLVAAGVSFEVMYTTHRYHAVELVIKALRQGYRKFLAIGGDGTIHEIVNGIFLQKDVPCKDVTMAVIPVGSGNDWSRMNKIPLNHQGAIEVFLRNRTILQDFAKVTYVESGVTNVRYMSNGCGVGLDANICLRCNIAKNKGKGGASSYVKAAFLSLIGRRSHKGEVVLDGKSFFRGNIFSVAVGIGKYSGGGMIQVPDAIVDDGVVSVMVARRISKIKFLSLFKYLFNGKVYSIREVSHCSASKVEIFTDSPDRLEIDGEVLGTTPVKIEVIPRSLRIVVGE